MKTLLRFVLLCLMAGSAFAQSSLPACQGGNASRWTNCFGTLTFADGEKYVGEYKDGKRNGQGTYTFASGAKYVGEYKDEQPNGQGTFTFADGEKYVGEYKDGKRNGQGTSTFADGAKYVGEYKDDKRNGQGTFTYVSGDKYVGEWRNFLRNGQGIEYRANGTISRSGRWADGKLVQSFWIDTNRFPFNAPTQTAQPSNASRDRVAAEAQAARQRQQELEQRLAAQATEAEAAKRRQQELEQQLACTGSVSSWTNCVGTETLPGGNKYVGEYRDGKFNGQGVLYDGTGRIGFQGRWEKGSLAAVGAAIDKTSMALRFPFYSSSIASATQAPVLDPLKAERDRLTAEVEAERKKRQELEQQLTSSKERERITAELDTERRKRQELQAELDRAKELSESRLAQQQRPQAAKRTERRVALVIGNAQYKKLRPLKNSVNDATDIDQALKQFGFQTTFLSDASLSQMRESTRRFAEQLSNADVALIYFAGHGVESKNKNYMIPVNSSPVFEYELAEQAYDVSAWLEMLETIKSNNAERVNIVILDACRDNNLFGSRSLNRGLSRMDAPAGTFLSYSTAPGKVAADVGDGGRNSPFTRNLLKAIQQPGQPIEEVFKEVRRNVTRETNGAQVPWESSSLTGFFSFRQTR